MSGIALPKVECVETEGNYGRFVAEPIENGMAVTLGNSLRRVLLRHLPGAAITWIQIEGAQHEFSTIPHIKEDTLDFLANVVALRIRPLSQRSGKMRLEVEGKKEVLASDIRTTADFEIANPELHLATLDSSKAKLSVEFNVELGRGYLQASSSDSLPIGAIPIDAIFTPVRKANYQIERSSVREGFNYDKLILEVWTDGTISPTEAITQSASILMEQFSCFRELAKAVADEGIELSWQRLLPPSQYNMPIDQLNLSTHTYNSLRRGAVTTLGQVLERGLDNLTALAGFGAKAREEVEAAIAALDLPGAPYSQEKKEKEKKRKKEKDAETPAAKTTTKSKSKEDNT
ncbi:MAG: DNA-directed RNA polymerase subunit alpha [Chloroflexi bacterium]|nr:DNA-directed RNA polymerase subunit alpha [Chloroflexota bacterium]MBM3154327.1 DNA-directed RNA polymerase subunit alpha [Chloroflexota bacterium]MBM3173322.1 DNA-directed RNA polymerase subunit alpha [Chloroflexota bacterium]MBM3174463.1 DNA-directed RNA polymerase subunit alpha [Chloroflexota bacterium]MBM4449587.1 DNA-directed RNA polymerase subunit alpha [Chloroflexota bacterium]